MQPLNMFYHSGPDYAVSSWVYRQWQRPSDGRYYRAALQQNLFGEWVFTRSWGTVYSHRGRQIETLCKGYDAGLAQLAAVEKRRRQRGYVAAGT